MTDTVTSNMGLTEPGVLQSPGPDYASLINADMGIIDSHDHTSGKGVQVPTAGLNIDADLDINGNNVNAARSYRMQNNGANLSGGDDINEIYVFAGDLWYNNSTGIPVQITNAGTISSGTNVFIPTLVSGSTSISPTDTANYYEVDITSADFTIALPAVSAVTPGTFYFFTDIEGAAGHPHTVTIAAQAGDTINTSDLSISLDVPFESVLLVSDGFSTWMASYFATKAMVEGRFGTDTQNVLVEGFSTTVQAEGTGNVFIGSTNNLVFVNGTTITVGFGPTFSTVDVDGYFIVEGKSLFKDTTLFTGTTNRFNGTTNFYGDVGTATGVPLDVGGNTGLAGNLTVIGTSTLDGTVTHQGLTTLNGNATINANLDVNGNATVRDELQVVGGGASLVVTAPTTITGTTTISSGAGNSIALTATPEIVLTGFVKQSAVTKVQFRTDQPTITVDTQINPTNVDIWIGKNNTGTLNVWCSNPPVSGDGTWLIIQNISSSSNNIVVRDGSAGGTTLKTLTPGTGTMIVFHSSLWLVAL